ncbi:brachyurin [Drosophila ficusphila]|uniref:brachyurin n=1 Tax=Drosophila ficusphila TaxID=30025 RepID=UPI0007E8257F|nr:brachyurin [Drosophila ficusphila]
MGANFKKSLMLILLAKIWVFAQPASDPNEVSSMFIKGRIISGSQAKSGQFPWQVILKRDEWDDLLCGASIINENWVLTAAHCTYGYSSIFLMFGSVDLNDENALNMTSTNIFVHPNYNDNLNNDVSLIRLPEPLTFSSTIQAIQLVTESQKSNNFVGTVATVAGFGLMDDEYLDYSQNLLYAQVQIINNGVCEPIFGTNVVLDSTMCAKGYEGSNMSICSGDSGGPLITYNSSTGQWQQIGINSFVAEDQCTASYPSGYVRLTSFLNFISDTTGGVL